MNSTLKDLLERINDPSAWRHDIDLATIIKKNKRPSETSTGAVLSPLGRILIQQIIALETLLPELMQAQLAAGTALNKKFAATKGQIGIPDGLTDSTEYKTGFETACDYDSCRTLADQLRRLCATLHYEQTVTTNRDTSTVIAVRGDGVLVEAAIGSEHTIGRIVLAPTIVQLVRAEDIEHDPDCPLHPSNIQGSGAGKRKTKPPGGGKNTTATWGQKPKA